MSALTIIATGNGAVVRARIPRDVFATAARSIPAASRFGMTPDAAWDVVTRERVGTVVDDAGTIDVTIGAAAHRAIGAAITASRAANAADRVIVGAAIRRAAGFAGMAPHPARMARDRRVIAESVVTIPDDATPDDVRAAIAPFRPSGGRRR